MSRVAKFTLVGSIVLSGLTVWGVHFLQEWERNSMYQGVIRDEGRRREKMQKRQAELDILREDGESHGVAQPAGSHRISGNTIARGTGEVPCQ